MGKLNTIAGLLSSYGVNVPLIQRDYVQGRVHQVTSSTSDELKEKYKEEEDKRNTDEAGGILPGVEER